MSRALAHDAGVYHQSAAHRLCRSVFGAALLIAPGVVGCGGETNEPTTIEDAGSVSADTAVDSSIDVDGGDPNDGGDSGSQEDTDTSIDPEPDALDANDDVEVDDEAPRIRDVRFRVGGSGDTELNDDDRTVYAPVERELEVTVLATDDTSDSSALRVELRASEDGAVVPGQTSTVEAGLWTLNASIGQGDRVEVHVADEAGNTTLHPFAIIAPSAQEAVPGIWDRRQHDTAPVVTGRDVFDFADDGTWAATLASDAELTGTWAVIGDEFRTDGNWIIPFTADGDVLGGSVYVGRDYLDVAPWSSDGEGAGVVGTWERSLALYDTLDAVSAASTLEGEIRFEEGGVYELSYVSSEAVAIYEESGTWEIVSNESYTENFGDYLFLTATEVDGETVDTPDTHVQLFNVVDGYLFVDPLIRNAD